MNDHDLLRMTLAAAIPLWIHELKDKPWAYVAARAQRSAQEVAEHGDIIQFKAKKHGETAAAFNALAEGLAALSFCPGGVKFLGDHWIASHPEGVQQDEPRAPADPP